MLPDQQGMMSIFEMEKTPDVCRLFRRLGHRLAPVNHSIDLEKIAEQTGGTEERSYVHASELSDHFAGAQVELLLNRWIAGPYEGIHNDHLPVNVSGVLHVNHDTLVYILAMKNEQLIAYLEQTHAIPRLVLLYSRSAFAVPNSNLHGYLFAIPRNVAVGAFFGTAE